MAMERKQKVMITLSIVLWIAGVVIATGLVDVSAFPSAHVVLPLAAILTGLTLVTRWIDSESSAAESAEARAERHHTAPAR